ncbi:MAG: hypothetical protein VX712_01360 [Bacteroidota bacterium]|nr:hypothetical protein [Bacteroidota bacterium]
MMNRFLVYTLFSLISFMGFSQDTLWKKRERVKKFIPMPMYVEHVGQMNDPVETMIKDGDTLVSVPVDFDPFDSGDYVQVPYNQKDSIFLSIYKDVVFNAGKRGSQNERMRYWKDDIRIFFDESVPQEHAEKLMDFAKMISADIDSLNISRNFDREKSNYLVYYLNREHPTDYDPRMGSSKGGYYINWNRKNQIYDGKLKVNTELAPSEDYQLRLLKYYFFMSLGHFKQSNKMGCQGYLASCNHASSVSKIDLALLKYHYSYGVCKGTDLESFTELTTKMNQKLKKDPNAKLYIVHRE